MTEKNNLEGCCAASWFFNLGQVHGIRTPETQEEFDKDFLTKGYSSINICVTNSSQKLVRKYLKNQGWEHIQMGSLWLHYIDYKTLKKYLVTDSVLKRLKEGKFPTLGEFSVAFTQGNRKFLEKELDIKFPKRGLYSSVKTFYDALKKLLEKKLDEKSSEVQGC